MLRLLLAAVIAITISGCAPHTQLARKAPLTSGDIRLVDNRTPEQKARKRDAMFSAIIFLAEAQFSPSVLDMLQQDLLAGSSSPRPITLEVDELRVGNFMPVALSNNPAAGYVGSALASLFVEKNTDWAFADSINLDRRTDALFCVFIGRLNGIPVMVAASEPYHASPWATFLYDDPDYQRALQVVVKRAANQAVLQTQEPQK